MNEAVLDPLDQPICQLDTTWDRITAQLSPAQIPGPKKSAGIVKMAIVLSQYV